MNQQALEDVGVAAQMDAAHPAGVVEMGEGAFDSLAPLPHQATAARAPNPAPIGVHRGLGCGLLGPIAAPAVRLGDVRPEVYGRKVDHRLIAVIALVGDNLFQRLGRLLWSAKTLRQSSSTVQKAVLVVKSVQNGAYHH